MDNKCAEFITKVPKVEIHLHAEGCIQLDTLWELYCKNNVSFSSVKSKEDLAKLYKVNTLEEFLSFFMNVLQRCVCSAEDVLFYVTDIREYLLRNNICYAEIFFSPTMLLKGGVKYEELADVLQYGADLLKRDNLECQFLIDVSRSFGVENATQNLENVLRFPRSAITGIGLGGSEGKGPAKDFAEVFAKAKANGLHCVAHAGEDTDSYSIRDSIDILGAARIGHGTSAMHDVEIRKQLKERQIPLEICITSNTYTRRYVTEAKDHPIRTFFDEGLIVTLNSDDPTIFGSELNDEYMLLERECGFSPAEVVQVMKATIESSFMEEKSKEVIIRKVCELARAYALL